MIEEKEMLNKARELAKKHAADLFDYGEESFCRDLQELLNVSHFINPFEDEPIVLAKEDVKKCVLEAVAFFMMSKSKRILDMNSFVNYLLDNGFMEKFEFANGQEFLINLYKRYKAYTINNLGLNHK